MPHELHLAARAGDGDKLWRRSASRRSRGRTLHRLRLVEARQPLVHPRERALVGAPCSGTTCARSRARARVARQRVALSAVHVTSGTPCRCHDTGPSRAVMCSYGYGHRYRSGTRPVAARSAPSSPRPGARLRAVERLHERRGACRCVAVAGERRGRVPTATATTVEREVAHVLRAEPPRQLRAARAPASLCRGRGRPPSRRHDAAVRAARACASRLSVVGDSTSPGSRVAGSPSRATPPAALSADIVVRRASPCKSAFPCTVGCATLDVVVHGDLRIPVGRS